MKYRKRPVVIDAWRWDESRATLDATGCHCSSHWSHRDRPDLCRDLCIRTLQGTLRVEPGDWIIRGVQGEYYPCKPDIFAATYEPAE